MTELHAGDRVRVTCKNGTIVEGLLSNTYYNNLVIHMAPTALHVLDAAAVFNHDIEYVEVLEPAEPPEPHWAGAKVVLDKDEEPWLYSDGQYFIPRVGIGLEPRHLEGLHGPCRILYDGREGKPTIPVETFIEENRRRIGIVSTEEGTVAVQGIGPDLGVGV